MTIIDLSRVVEEAMPVYPGTEPPRLEPGCTVAADGFAETRLRLYSHAGTHLDAPGHLRQGAPRLADLDAGRFVGPGLVLDVSGVRGRPVEIADLEPYGPALEGIEFALFHSGWARYWGEPRYFDGYPVLSAAAARWLAARPLKGVGVDMMSVDPMNAAEMTVHEILLDAGFVIFENLAGLDALLGKQFLFSGLPLKLATSDGSPVRAVAVVL